MVVSVLPRPSQFAAEVAAVALGHLIRWGTTHILVDKPPTVPSDRRIVRGIVKPRQSLSKSLSVKGLTYEHHKSAARFEPKLKRNRDTMRTKECRPTHD